MIKYNIYFYYKSINKDNLIISTLSLLNDLNYFQIIAKRGKLEIYQGYPPEVLDAAVITAVKSKKDEPKTGRQIVGLPSAAGNYKEQKQIIPEAIKHVIAEKVV